MPRLSHSVPKYSRHKASGQAVVTIQGKDHYLGRFGSPASKLEYDRLIGEWMAAGRPIYATPAPQALTIVELIVRYWDYAKVHYIKDDRPTSEQHCIRSAVAPFVRSMVEPPRWTSAPWP